jgi:hypothetical protein
MSRWVSIDDLVARADPAELEAAAERRALAVLEARAELEASARRVSLCEELNAIAAGRVEFTAVTAEEQERRRLRERESQRTEAASGPRADRRRLRAAFRDAYAEVERRQAERRQVEAPPPPRPATWWLVPFGAGAR